MTNTLDSFAEIPVRDIMSPQVETLDRNDTLEIAQDVMKQKRIRHFPVVDADEVVGVMSQRDLFHATLGSVMQYGEKAERAFLTTVAVKDVMSEPPVTIAPDETIQEAAHRMVEKQIGCLPVIENEKLIGMVTESDILRQVAKT